MTPDVWRGEQRPPGVRHVFALCVRACVCSFDVWTSVVCFCPTARQLIERPRRRALRHDLCCQRTARNGWMTLTRSPRLLLCLNPDICFVSLHSRSPKIMFVFCSDECNLRWPGTSAVTCYPWRWRRCGSPADRWWWRCGSDRSGRARMWTVLTNLARWTVIANAREPSSIIDYIFSAITPNWQTFLLNRWISHRRSHIHTQQRAIVNCTNKRLPQAVHVINHLHLQRLSGILAMSFDIFVITVCWHL